VVNGKIVASSSSTDGSRSMSLRRKVRIKGSCWIAARCGSKLMVQHGWPIHLGAHTSPVYAICGNQEIFNASDASYMLTLIDGGLTYLDTLSVRYDEERHRRIKAVYERAKAKIHQQMHKHSDAHGRSH